MVNLKDHIAYIRRLEIKTKGLSKHLFSGEYHSAFKGRGMAFSEVRNYQMGDEVRTIDWNVTARYQAPYVKVFQEERELTVMFIIDISGSNEYGSTLKTKRELAVELAAVLGFSAIENRDKVGMILVSNQVEKYIAPKKGKQHVLRMLSELIQFEPTEQKTCLNEAFKFFRNVEKKRCITFVMSDFVDENPFIEGLKLTNKRHDTIALHIFDPAESELPNVGWVSLFNAENNQTSWVDSSSAQVRNQFKNNFDQRLLQLKNDLKKSGVDYVGINTNEDWVKPLIGFFKNR
jgi:uncharacterized protein (DUF58 family)